MNKATFNPEKLRLIVAVAETASLSKVALRERLSQPYLSKVIGLVEAACGGRIFLRTGRGMKLTEFGEAVLPRFRSWLSEGLAMAEDIRGLSGTVSGLMRLAVIAEIPRNIYPSQTGLLYSARSSRHRPVLPASFEMNSMSKRNFAQVKGRLR